MSAGITPLPMLGTQGTNHHSANHNIPGLQNKKQEKKNKKYCPFSKQSKKTFREIKFVFGNSVTLQAEAFSGLSSPLYLLVFALKISVSPLEKADAGEGGWQACTAVLMDHVLHPLCHGFPCSCLFVSLLSQASVCDSTACSHKT